ncbi:UNVERIFIED_CONTAM: hypothetical protein Slati_2391200 [Sesamum latifolium]|uniref:Uncharacterized protein n=1 Tax=Sesamum latifolium TaxID=2727402 RepID=A0AAW2WFG1_9LAMI
MAELTNTRQWKDELVIDYINRWRSKLKLQRQTFRGLGDGDVHPRYALGSRLYFTGIKPRNFEEFVTRAHNMELSIANHQPKFPVGYQNKNSKDEDFSEPAAKELMTPVKFSPSEKRSDMLDYESCSALDDEDTADTNVTNITPTNDMYVLENKQKVLPSPLSVPPKFKLNNFEPIQIEASIADMEPFTKVVSYGGNVKLYLNPGGMQEAMHSKFLTSQLIKEVNSKATPSESNTKEFNKLTIGEVKINDSQGAKAELIEPVIGLHPLVSNEPLLLKNQVKKISGAFSLKDYHLLAKSRYDFFSPSRLDKLNPELTGKKIHRLTKAQHELRRQGFHVDQSHTGLGFAPEEPVRMHMKRKDNCVVMQYISMEKGANGESGRPNDNHVSIFNQLRILVPRASVFQRLGETMRTSSSSRGHRQQGSVSKYLGDGYAHQLKKRSQYEETYKPKENGES